MLVVYLLEKVNVHDREAHRDAVAGCKPEHLVQVVAQVTAVA